jgi:hydroxypyruvate isomerase
MNRRRLLRSSLAAAAASASGSVALAPATSRAQAPADAAPKDFRIRNGRVRQSIMGWTYKDRMDMPALARLCKDIGFSGMEGISRDLYPQVRDLGLEISLVSSHGFAEGPCNPAFRQTTVDKLRDAIQAAAAAGCGQVITFTGMRYEGMKEDEAARRCIEAWQEVMPLAEEKKVNLVLEHLNSRDDTHPMKGHPGYFGDHVDFCADLVKAVGSPRMKLLFDIYHVSIMDGDVIRRIRQHHPLIGHYHTAGNPGRAELDDRQEINYPAILREILATGYTGFVTQEFIPTWEDHEHALRHAAMVCDV